MAARRHRAGSRAAAPRARSPARPRAPAVAPNQLKPPIIPRGYRFVLPHDRILNWNARGLHSTQFMNALSPFFPLGETFFINSVSRLREFVPPGTQLDRDVRAFVAQEAFHSREHEVYNEALRRVFAVDVIEAAVAVVLWPFEHGPRALALAGTVAMEHLTAALGHAILDDESVLAGSEPHYAALWKWHAHEETEHKAVAFDVYEAAYGRGAGAYALRIAAFLIAMSLFLSLFIPTFVYFVAAAGGLFDGAGWRRIAASQWAGGGQGVLRRLRPLVLDFFRRDFHPWDHRNMALLSKLRPPPA